MPFFSNETGEEIGIDDRHEILESAHAAVEIRYAQGRGRYAVASRDIEIGTTLFREQPLTCTLHPDRFGTNCQHCFQPIKGVVPCLQCTWVCFCSSSCRSQAAASYHQYECGIIKLLLESGLNVYAYLALRCVTKEGLHNLLKIKEDLKHPDEKSGTTADSVGVLSHFLIGNSTISFFSIFSIASFIPPKIFETLIIWWRTKIASKMTCGCFVVWSPSFCSNVCRRHISSTIRLIIMRVRRIPSCVTRKYGIFCSR